MGAYDGALGPRPQRPETGFAYMQYSKQDVLVGGVLQFASSAACWQVARSVYASCVVGRDCFELLARATGQCNAVG